MAKDTTGADHPFMPITWFASPKRRASESACVEAKLRPFGQTGSNPVRSRIRDLRKRRDAGLLNETEFAVEVAELLGGGATRPLSELPLSFAATRVDRLRRARAQLAS
jgi:hypothetical protein